MADRMNPQQRRKCMQSIRSKDTKTELLVRKFLFSQGSDIDTLGMPAEPQSSTADP